MSVYKVESKRPSWVLIIFFMIVFFPIGIYLVIKRSTIPKYSDGYERNQGQPTKHLDYEPNNSITSFERGKSWGIIIPTLILFFPIGIPMLIKKVASEKHRYEQNGKTMMILGWILIGVGIMYVFSGFSGDVLVENGESLIGTMFTGLLIFVGSGFLLVYQGQKLRRRAYRINRYTSIISTRKEYSLRNISAAYPAIYESTCRDLQFMIDSGFLQNTYLDLQREELVMAKSEIISATINEERSFLKTDPSYHIIKCPGCSALNKITQGGDNECEYCGSPI